jgi:PAS domain S-box-containing protein
MTPGIEKLVGDGARLEALGSYAILDTPAEALFDDLVQAAKALCDAPIALVSLVDANRQWFKARVGIEFQSTPVDQAVCAYAMHSDGLFVIPDLTADARTMNNPLVTAEGGIRFYAGAPLVDPDGHPLGSLCVIDKVPRPEGLTAAQREGLLALGRVVISLITMRRKVRSRDEVLATTLERGAALRKLRARIDLAQEAGRIGTFDYDLSNGMLRASPEFCRIFGLGNREMCVASEIEGLLVPEDLEALQAMRANPPKDGQEVLYRIVRPSDGALRWISRRGSYEFTAEGQPRAMVGTVEDVTERVTAEQQQAIVNQEISHRLKNGLAMAQAIVTQTVRRLVSPEVLAVLAERLGALGAAHDMLNNGEWRAAPLGDVVDRAVRGAAQDARVDRRGPDVPINAKTALSVSLLLHELLTNAVKHGSLSVETGRVAIDWRIEGEELVLDWTETGGPPAIEPATRGFGSRLIALGLSGTGGATLRYEGTGFAASFRTKLETARRP